MRNLVLALVLANLAFAAWHSWFSRSATPSGLPAPDSGSIMLASELETALPDVAIVPADIVLGPNAEDLVETAVGPPLDELETEIEEAVDVRAAAASREDFDCISVGPFRELSQATTAAANLRADGLEPTQRRAESDIWAGYWVYIERIESVPAAQAILDNLHANGITDSYVIPNSDSGTLISLGVFTQIVRASRRLEEVHALGYEATIADRMRRAEVYWIDVPLERGRLLDFERLQPPGRIIRLEQRPCDDAPL